MLYQLITYYYDGETIIDEFDDADDAHQAYTDADWCACNAPANIAGDMRRITIKHGDKVIKTRSYL